MVVARSPPRRPATPQKTSDAAFSHAFLEGGSTTVGSRDAGMALDFKDSPALCEGRDIPRVGSQSLAMRMKGVESMAAGTNLTSSRETIQAPVGATPSDEAFMQRDRSGREQSQGQRKEGFLEKDLLSGSAPSNRHVALSPPVNYSVEAREGNVEEVGLLSVSKTLDFASTESSKHLQPASGKQCIREGCDLRKSPGELTKSTLSEDTAGKSLQTQRSSRPTVDHEQQTPMNDLQIGCVHQYVEATSELGIELNLDGALVSEEAFQQHFDSFIAPGLEEALDIGLERELYNRCVEIEGRTMQLISNMDHVFRKAKRRAKGESRSARLRADAAKEALAKSEQLLMTTESHVCQGGSQQDYEKKLRGSEERSKLAAARREQIRTKLLECTKVRCKAEQLKSIVEKNKECELRNSEEALHFRNTMAAFTRLSFLNSKDKILDFSVASGSDGRVQRRVVEHHISILPDRTISREGQDGERFYRLSPTFQDAIFSRSALFNADVTSSQNETASISGLTGDMGKPRIVLLQLVEGDEESNKETRNQVWDWIEEAVLPPYRWVEDELEQYVLCDDGAIH